MTGAAGERGGKRPRGVPVDTAPGSYEMIFGKRAFFGYTLAPDRESTPSGSRPPLPPRFPQAAVGAVTQHRVV